MPFVISVYCRYHVYCATSNLLSKLIISLYIVMWNTLSLRNFNYYAWNWHFKKLLTTFLGCPEVWFLRVWVSRWCPELGVLTVLFWRFGSPKEVQTPCWLRLCYPILSIFKSFHIDIIPCFIWYPVRVLQRFQNITCQYFTYYNLPTWISFHVLR